MRLNAILGNTPKKINEESRMTNRNSQMMMMTSRKSITTFLQLLFYNKYYRPYRDILKIPSLKNTYQQNVINWGTSFNVPWK